MSRYGKNAELIARAKAFSDAGLSVAFNCPDSQESHYKQLFAGYPFVEVNPKPNRPPALAGTPQPVCFDEAADWDDDIKAKMLFLSLKELKEIRG